MTVKNDIYTANSRDAIVSALRDQIACIPDLKPTFIDWDGVKVRRISVWLEPLRLEVTKRLQSLGFSETKQKALVAADFASFTCLWWPNASFERLKTLAFLVIWLFTWDDEIDEPTGAYSESFMKAQEYRDNTLRFVGRCLGLVSLEDDFQPLNYIIGSFDAIGERLQAFYNLSQRQRFYDEIVRFLAASKIEQQGRLAGRVFTLEEYWNFRLGTSAVFISSAVGEYSISSQLPAEIMECDFMKTVWRETNMIISIINDLLSLRKEMRLGCIDSIVPLTFAVTKNLQTAVYQSVEAVIASKYRLDEAAKSLLKDIEDEKLREQVHQFIEAQRSNCVGNLVWSLETHRYDMSNAINDDGSQRFVS